MKSNLPFPSLSPHGCCQTMGINFFVAMLTSSVQAVSLQASWNQPSSQKAPQPQLPDASGVRMSVSSCSPNATKRETPLQSLRNSCHHARSDLAPLFRLKWWWGFQTVALKSNSRRRNALPGLTTVAACCSWPASDNKPRLVQHLFWSHSLTQSHHLTSLPWGSRSSTWIVSVSIRLEKLCMWMAPPPSPVLLVPPDDCKYLEAFAG